MAYDDLTPLAAGDAAPDFTLQNQYGESVTLSQVVSTKPVVLAFVPAAFTGICTGEFCELRDNIKLFDEAHVTTIGVHPDYRGRGLGELLFVALIDEAIRRNVAWLTLEVRVSNVTAQNLYQKYGFTVQGRRPRYYSDNNEDAYIMWSESLKDPVYRDRLAQYRRDLIARLAEADSPATHPASPDEAPGT